MNKKFKVEFKRTPEQIALVKQMGSKKRSESLAAAEALAAVMTRPILQVIEQAPVISNLYTTQSFDEGTPASIPLDPYFDVRNRNFINVWQQSQPGGTAMNFVQGATDLFVQTYPIVSEIAMNKNQLRAGRLDYLAANMTRIVQEVLLVQETNAAFILFNSLPAARIDGNAANTATSNLTVARSNTAGVFQIDDFNTIQIGYDRTTASWVGGTPVNDRRSITDLLGSPEWMGQIRAIAYQPSNTRNGAQTVAGTPTNTYGGASSIAAPESFREAIFNSANIPTLFDINLHKVYEMGVGRPYNQMFATAAGSLQFVGNNGGSAAQFNASTEQIVVGLNSDMFDLVRLRMNQEAGEFGLVADDSQNFNVRSDKLGFIGYLCEGYVSVEGRAKYGLIY
jgi:hypothetical protein